MRSSSPPLVPPPHTAAASTRGGCLSLLWLPPLSALVVGLLLAGFLLQSGAGATTFATPVEGVRDTATAPGGGTLAAFFTPEVHFWAGQIQRWADQAQLDPNLVATVMQIESCGDPLARSAAGAMGLFQVMPYHFAAGENPYDPDTNARRGLAYLQQALREGGGDSRLAFAAYNGGLGVLGRAEILWPAETQRYVYWAAGMYSDALYQRRESPRLQEWLLAGGVGLCRQARQRLGLGE